MRWRESEICDCVCHQKGKNIMHSFPCCEYCYQTYITPRGELIIEKFEALLRGSYMDYIKDYAARNNGLDEKFINLQFAMMGDLANNEIRDFCTCNMKEIQVDNNPIKKK